VSLGDLFFFLLGVEAGLAVALVVLLVVRALEARAHRRRLAQAAAAEAEREMADERAFSVGWRA